MKKVIVTLDLDSENEPDYRALDKLMADLGFSVVSPKKGLDLPHNTYYGKIRDDLPMDSFRDLLWGELKKSHLQPTALFGGELQDWALRVK